MPRAKATSPQPLPRSLSFLEPHRDKPAVAAALPRLLLLPAAEHRRRDPARRLPPAKHPVEIEAEQAR